MPRARSTSVVSNAANGVRRSSRAPSKASSPAPAPTPKKAAAKAKRGRSVSAAPAVVEEGEEEAASSPGAGRKRKASTPKPTVAPKKPKVRVPVQGINPIPTLYPTPSPAFTFPIPPFPENAPRHAFVFGNGDFGQHGLGVGEKVLCEIVRPRPHAWFDEKIEEGSEAWKKGIAGIECGGMHTLALDGLGRVWSWGINDNAALGRQTNDVEGMEAEVLETQPMLVEGLEDFHAVRVAAGDSVSLALSSLGELRCWGSFRASEGILGFDGAAGSALTQLRPSALPNLDKQTVVQIATGDDHFLALTTKGEVFACGNGEQCQLGRRVIQRHRTHGLTPERLALRNIVLVGSGSFHSFAVNADGKVFAWGLNSFRQTGVSDDKEGWADIIGTPTEVDSLHPDLHGGARVVQIAGGTHHSIFLLSNGEVWSCGRCDGSETGLGPDHPEMLAGKEREKEAKVQRAAMELVETDRATGAGMTGEEAAQAAAEAAAQGVPLPNPYIPQPTRISFPGGDETKIIHVAASSRHNFAVTADGSVYAWGAGNTSQLGLGDEEEAETPTRVMSVKMQSSRVIWASTGGQHSVVLTL